MSGARKTGFGNEPGVGSIAITPSDTVDITRNIREIYVGVGGDVVVVDWDGNVTTWKNVPTGGRIPVKARRINATNTTATNMVGIY